MGNNIKNKHQQYVNDIKKNFIFDNLYDSIEDINDCGRYTNNPVSFYRTVPNIINNKINIDNDSDIIFGFYSSKNITLKILYKGYEIVQHIIPSNLFCLPQTNFLFICCLEKGDIELEIITEYGEFYIIYGLFSNDLRTYLMNNIIYTTIFNIKKETDLIYFGKKLHIDTQISDNNYDVIKLPLLYIETEIYKKYIANKVTKQIRNELLEVTMNPNRLCSFMSIDEIKKYNL